MWYLRYPRQSNRSRKPNRGWPWWPWSVTLTGGGAGRTHIKGARDNWLPKVALWTPHSCLHTHIHTRFYRLRERKAEFLNVFSEGWRAGSVVESTCCTTMKTWVQIPAPHKQLDGVLVLRGSVTPGLWGVEIGGLLWIASCRPGWRRQASGSGRDFCDNDTQCPPLGSAPGSVSTNTTHMPKNKIK